MNRWVLVALLLSLPASGVVAGDELVEQALKNMESERSDEWAFTETTLTEGKTIVKSYDPQRAEGARWKLVSVDGRAPKADELKRIERQNRRDEDRGREREGDDSVEEETELHAMISPGSLSLISEDETHAVYRFKPGGDGDREKKMLEYVDGKLEVQKAGPTVSSIELESRGPFSPAFGVKIEQFMTHMTFAPLEQGGPAFPKTVRVKVQGRAFMVKKLDEDARVTYSDWKRVAP